MRIRQFLLFLPFFFLSCNLYAQEEPRIFQQDPIAKIAQRNRIEREGEALEMQGFYEEALKKYRLACQPEFINDYYEAATARGSIRRILRKQKKFREALDELQWVIQHNPKGTGWLDDKLELEALIKSQEVKSYQPIYEYITYLRNKHKRILPPKGFAAVSTEGLASTIIQLYDYIGDYDAGVEFMEDFLKFYKKIGPGNPYQPANPYFQIKQAFLDDKKEGRKGRATQALMESRFFPW